ncbi:dipeptide transporter permease DppB [Escherichia coli]|uniref:Dipeptide transporter permease DppB n=1 Tax=Escherichia coli TaxID=562 RepID=A0A377DL66_ECOLX|nr:dipeptide transporter permease DppB [Escherichia coli]
MIPGDPVMIMAGERGISPERHAQLLAELGLDKPMWQQYLHYIWGVMHGDLGISMKSRIPVWEEFVPRFQATLELGVCAMIFATAVGIPVGVLAAVKRGSIFDHTAVGLALTGYSMPIFWWGMMLIMLVSVHWNLTPVSGRVSDMVFLDDSNPLTGFMLIDTAIWGEDGNFIDAVAPYDLACHCAGYYSAGGHCAYDTLLDAGSAGRGLHPHRARQRANPHAGDYRPCAA